MRKKDTGPSNLIAPKDLDKFSSEDMNVYGAIVVIGQRSRQIATHRQLELREKIEDFAVPTDSLDEVFENPEQIEISKRYECMPKSTLEATEEFLRKDIVFRKRQNEEESPPSSAENR